MDRAPLITFMGLHGHLLLDRRTWSFAKHLGPSLKNLWWLIHTPLFIEVRSMMVAFSELQEHYGRSCLPRAPYFSKRTFASLITWIECSLKQKLREFTLFDDRNR